MAHPSLEIAERDAVICRTFIEFPEVDTADGGEKHRNVLLTDVVSWGRFLSFSLVIAARNQVDDGVVVVDIVADGF